MKYKKFIVDKYKGVIGAEIKVIDEPVPLIGVNESGKSSILEAITHFDHRNDTFFEEKGWQIINRYDPGSTTFTVSSLIEITQEECDQLIEEYTANDSSSDPVSEELPESQDDSIEATTEPAEPEDTDMTLPESVENTKVKVDTKTNQIRVSRIFNTSSNSNYYSINDETSDVIDLVASRIVSDLPRIYYFDSFIDNNIPNEVPFADYIADKNTELNEAQKVINGAFEDVGNSLHDFFTNTDVDSQDTLLNEVNDNLTEKIINDWNKMHIFQGEVGVANNNGVKISLRLNNDRNGLLIKILEITKDEKGKEKSPISFSLNERSLGFRWFFNFSARKCFGATTQGEFLYLFDEPGSYLHNGAQRVLLAAMVELSHDHPVIFSTHSEFLLNPDQININNIRVVQKDKYSVKVVPLSEVKSDRNLGALSTLWNALRMQIPLETVLKKQVIVTEGIVDYYFWKSIVEASYLPGFGAGNNKYLLSIAIGAANKYVALFDGDEEGDTAQQQYSECFLEDESAHWLSYKNKNGKPVKLEQLISSADVIRLKELTSQNDLKQAITTMYISKKTAAFWKDINQETRDNVQGNITEIAKIIKISQSNLRYNFQAK